ncbi:MAG: hypothetical protein II306_03205, partial [Clostridia bacterium]|nr:hypothetical protein [Clostridia bacterium]
SDSWEEGIRKLQQVSLQGTVANRAKAYHQLAQSYLKRGKYCISFIKSSCFICIFFISYPILSFQGGKMPLSIE